MLKLRRTRRTESFCVWEECRHFHFHLSLTHLAPTIRSLWRTHTSSARHEKGHDQHSKRAKRENAEFIESCMSESQRKWVFFLLLNLRTRSSTSSVAGCVFFRGKFITNTGSWHDWFFRSFSLSLARIAPTQTSRTRRQWNARDGKWWKMEKKKKSCCIRERETSSFTEHRTSSLFWSLSSFMCTQKTSVAAGNEKENFQIFQTSHILHRQISSRQERPRPRPRLLQIVS